MIYWIYDIPTWSVAILFTAIFVGIYMLSSFWLRPRLLRLIHAHERGNEVVGYLLSNHGVLYGILLGLLAVAAYENYTKSDELVTLEAAQLAALYRDVSAFPEPARAHLVRTVRAYADFLLHEGWEQQRRGQVPNGDNPLVGQLQTTLVTHVPTDEAHGLLHAETLAQFNALIETRQQRLHAVTRGIPPILWYVVFVGALITLLLFLMLDMAPAANYLLGTLLSFFLATVITLIAAMDNPFRGDVCISPEPYQVVYDTLMSDDTPGGERPSIGSPGH